ncbi:MAG: hypothetical protein RIF41_05915, partial [Polyangiaceae bacterium]
AALPRAHIYLVPGFFGFAAFGDFAYFTHVRDHLAGWLERRGVDAAIHDAPTYPTKSLRHRATKLAEIVADTADGDGPIHLVGHSTGGLDARLLASSHAALGPAHAAVSPRVRTVVAVATPHHGSPVAGFFTGLMGQRLLRLLSLVTVYGLRFGRLPLPALVFLAGAVSSTGALRFANRAFDQIYHQVLQDFDEARRAQIEAYFDEARRDQSLLVQLTPEGLDLLDVLIGTRPDVRQGSVITRARPPALGRQLRVGLHPGDQAAYAVYRALHAVASKLPPSWAPDLDEATWRTLTRAYGDRPGLEDNDAMVPTLSQVWGEVVHAAWADHLDVIGHFHAPDREPLHVDWLHSGSGFGHADFERLWDDVAAFAFPATSR